MNARALRPLVHGATLAGLLFAAYLFLVAAPAVGTFGYDAWAYWSVSLDDPYAVPLGGLGSFPYSPPIAMLFSAFGLVPWEAFVFLWACLGVATVIWLGGRWALVLFAFPPVALELYHGNIHLLLAAAVALGFRHPWAWAFPLLAKPTVGVGLVWFAVRREWRSLGVALGVAGAVAFGTFVAAPTMWAEWLGYLAPNIAGTPGGPTVGIPLWARLSAATAIVAWGARTDRRWTVALGATLALPVLWFAGLSVLCAAAPALRERRSLPAAGSEDTAAASPGAVTRSPTPAGRGPGLGGPGYHPVHAERRAP
jgi:hypothetical protein